AQQTQNAHQANVKKDATLREIAGIWTGEMQFTRMEGFENMPAEQLPANIEEIIAEILSKPAGMELEIEEDGNWYLDVDIEMGMMIGSNDFDDYEGGSILLTLKDGTFNISYKENINEDGIQGSASLEFNGSVFESSGGLTIEGRMLLSANQGDAQIFEEGNYKLALSEAAEPEANDSGIDSGTDAGAQVPEANGGAEATTDLSTSERPDLGDFLWYLDGVYYDGVPDGSILLTDFSDLKGGWKALFYYDPDNIANAFGYDFLNIALDGEVGSATMTLDWYMYVWEDESYDKSGDSDTILSGAFDQDGITVSGDGYRIVMYAFYELNAKQYGLGYMELQSGEPTFVALIRP
ncbi:MAG: hypothetical protein GX847_11220, partial [Clostridiales bacterium]|nr:hypothetical protein [Clostridiales bacterium]